MATKFKYPSLSMLCEGCLSSDRTLKVVQDVEVIKFYRNILEKTDFHQYRLTLCWECIALIKKTLRFRLQVQQAHSILDNNVTHTSIQPLSALKTTRPVYLDVSSLSNQSDQLKSEGDSQPREVAFVKVENDDEEYFVCDDSTEDKCSEPILSSVNGCDEFNASDDEPLTRVKKASPEVKRKRGRPRKTESACKQDGGVKRRRDKCGVITDQRVMRKLDKLNVAPGLLEMVVLSWDEVEEERQRALVSGRFPSLQYKCHRCVVGFTHRSKLENHMRKHAPAAGSLVCEVCDVRCGDSGPALAAHRRRHRVRWRCVRCGRQYSRAAVAADHAARAHGAAAPSHRCALCDHTYTSLSQLRRHMRSHSAKRECSLCGKMFGDAAALRTHLFIHKGEKEFDCPKCDKRFLFKKAMEIHLDTHNQSANLYCHECDLNFKNKMSHYQHMKYNLKHIDPAKLKYACHLCDKKFAKASRLHEHNMGVHLKVTPYKCVADGCTFSFSSRPALRTHVRMIHRNARAHRNYVCHTCGKAYTTKKVLEGHLRTHSGERPYRCSVCAASFSYRGALYNHTRLLHSQQKRAVQPAESAVPDVPSWSITVPNATQHVPNTDVT